MLTTGWAYEYVFSVMSGIKEAIKDQQIDLYLFLCYGYCDETPAFNRGEYNIFNLINYEDYDGVILFSNIFNSLDILAQEKKRILKSGIPAISLEYEVDGIDYVGTDNYSGMEEMVNHLISVHKVSRFAYIGGPDGNYESMERQRAFCDVLQKNRLPINEQYLFLHGNWSYEFAYDAVLELIKHPENLPEAIVCVNDEGAIAAMTALHKHGIQVPEDILVVGFDDTAVSSLFTPSISTVNRNWDCLGHDAILHLLKQMAHETVASREILPSRAVTRGSCGCVQHSDTNQKNYCMNKFYQQRIGLAFNRHVRHIEEIFIETEDPNVLWKRVRNFFTHDHEVEGSDFCILMEKNIVSKEISLDEIGFQAAHKRKKGYSEELQVAIHLIDGKERPCGAMIKTNELFPSDMLSNQNDIFVFVPFHFQDTVLGYFVGKNSFDLIENRFCYDWGKGISNGVAKFCEKYTFALMNQKITELSIHDSLTGLLNRQGLKKTAYALFAANKATRQNTIVVFADINSMKSINDDHGHLYGDLAIKTVAEVIQKQFPQEWLKIRFGGDEYLIIGSSVSEEQVADFSAQAQNALAAHVSTMALPYPLTISIGYQLISPDSSISLDEAISQADEIMYHQKTAYYQQEHIDGRANKHNISEALTK